MKINISEKKFILSLILIIIIIVCFSIVGQLSRYFWGHGRLLGFIYFFNVGEEANFPTVFSVFLILFASIIALLIYINIKNNNRISKYWLGLFILLLYLSIDEGWVIHERIGRPIKLFIDFDYVFYVIGSLLIITVIIFILVTVPFFLAGMSLVYPFVP